MNPNAGKGVVAESQAQPMSTAVHRRPYNEIEDLAPYLTYASYGLKTKWKTL
jgi:hypothetical protein